MATSLKKYVLTLGMTCTVGALGCSTSASMSASTETPEEAPAEPVPAPAPAEDPEDVHVEGDHLTIDKKIHFAHDSDEIQSDSFELLDHIATTLKNHEEIKSLHVIGHTDESGDDDHNMELSERRAASVAKALEERGVPQTLDAKGSGETEPTCTEDTEECHEANRRVEFVIERS